MAFTIEVDGLEELIQKMDGSPKKAVKVAAYALYDGAGIVADAVSKAVDSIATEPFHYARGGKKRLPSPEEKALVASAKHGVAKFRKTGLGVQTSVGFRNAGYGSLGKATKPIPQIAASINSGTSFMKKQPFMRQAFSTSQGAAASAIEAGIASRLDELEIS